jgi:hypothetical protein
MIVITIVELNDTVLYYRSAAETTLLTRLISHQAAAVE